MERRTFVTREGEHTNSRILSANLTAHPEVPEEIEDEPEPKDPPLVRFRRMARLVRILCGVCKKLRGYAIDAGYMDNYMVEVTGRRARKGGTDDEEEDGEEEEVLTFDPKQFRVRCDPVVGKSVKQSCLVKPDQRTPEDIKSIAMCMRAMPSFRKYSKEMQELLCKIVRYEKCENRRVVLRKGHIGYNLYFLYSGAVNVILAKENDIFTKQDLIPLKKGACFGEIALVQNTRRNATIVCSEDCEFFVVDKDDFVENQLDVRMREEFDLRYNFFRNWNLLESESEETTRKLSLQSRLMEFNHNKVIVKDSRDNEWLYFVIRGTCDVLRVVDLDGCPEYKRLFCNSPTPRPTKTPISARSKDAVRTATAYSSPRIRPKTAGPVLQRQDPDGDVNSVNSSPSEEQLHPVITPSAAVQKSSSQNTSLSKDVVISDVGPGVFVKIDRLRDGGCYALDSLVETPPYTSLVSQGCEVIQLSKAKFKEIVEEEVLGKIKPSCKPYPTDDDLFRRFMSKSRWDSYKQEVVAMTLVDQQRERESGTNLRSLKKMRYRSYEEMKKASPYADQDAGPEPITLNIALHELSTNIKSKHKRFTSCPVTPARYTNRETHSQQRPKTCLPRQRLPHSQPSSRARSARSGLIPILSQKWTPDGSNDSELNSRYKLRNVPLYVKGSKRTLQIATGVDSAAHAHRMRNIQN